MTDVSSVKAHADLQPASVAFLGGPPPPALTNGSPALDGTIDEEESSTIKCICGFSDDDGNTVLCEKCDTWQHIVCYYESAHHVPEVHECTDCLPRAVDSKGAAEKQRQRRELHNIHERKGRPRTTTKSHKKRVKDPLASVQPNGWAVHANNDLHYNPERKSGSPRDQPPPSKRPKTSHRSSASVSQAPTLVPASRKRGGSVMLNGHSPVKSPSSPDGPIEEFSLEFMNLYRQPFEGPTVPTDGPNTFDNIAIANDMHLWRKDRDALAEATGGKNPGDVFVRIDSTVKDLEDTVGPQIVHHTEENTTITAHGLHPLWQFVTTETPIADGGFIGELRGRIGRRQDYIADPQNRWGILRHPEPFIFFPPYLPIYLDTRNEGSKLRFARRSCSPNMTMKIFVENEHVDRFCLVATRQIDPTEELTVGWDIDAEIQKQLSKVANGEKEAFRKLQPWAACILANFGGCACDTSTGHECLLDRLRRNNVAEAEPAQPPKSTKSRKIKKSQISPLSTGRATNSRAGSEAFMRDANEDENMDSRSTSGSHKSSSRDITPATHFSVDGGDLKMSDREKRKLLQQERLFEQLEYDEQHKGRGRKRNSAGSTLNTPSLLSSKQLGHPEPAPSARQPREHSHGVARKTSGNSTKVNGRSAPKARPVYVDNSTQTEDDNTSRGSPAIPAKVRVMRPPMSFKRKLLQQAQEDKLQRERIRSTSVKMESKSPALKDVTSSKPSPVPPIAPLEEPTAMEISTTETEIQAKPKEPTPAKGSTPAPAADVEMKDDDEATTPTLPEAKVEEMPDAPDSEPLSISHPPIQPPPPPWSNSAPEPTPTSPVASSEKPSELHMDIPKPDLTNSANSANSVVTPGSVSSVVTGGTIAQSPISTGPVPSPFSPSVTHAVNPGPTRKKLSLSDYTSRRAKLAQSHSTGPHSTPPLAHSQSTSSPTMSNSSLPNQTSPPSKSVDLNLPTVTEESKVTQQPPVTTTTSTSS